MRNTFSQALESELTLNETVRTENGAVAFASTGKPFLDAFWKISSCRNIQDEKEIIRIFAPCFREDFTLACKLLFYIRDCRQGCGEKRTFNILFNWLLSKSDSATKLIKLIPEYGSWKDIVQLIAKTGDVSLYELVQSQLDEDIKNFKKGKSISLLAKWLPSINTSTKETVKLAKEFCKRLGYRHAKWRKLLSALRKHIDVIERKMCSGDWSEIDYNTVPSKANLIYKNAFMKHDGERRSQYLEKLARGDEDVKINAGVLEPYEIVHKYCQNMRSYGWNSASLTDEDASLEALWKNLPRTDILQGKNMICVHDNSGSMSSPAGEGATCHNVADALAIYCSELLSGPWKNKFITFSENPKLVDLSDCDTLAEKITTLYKKIEIANTNIERVFDLILKTAIANHSEQEEIPDILILSDMEFDNGISFSDGYHWGPEFELRKKTLFEDIAKKWASAGYKLPKLIYWNICSRTMGIPVRENDNGVLLVSGFSKNIFKMVASAKLDPFEALKDQLNVPRYEAVEKALTED